VKALNRENEAISHASVDMLCALMHPMHDESSDLRQEQLNKSCLLSNHKFLDALLNMWIRHVTLGTGALVVSVSHPSKRRFLEMLLNMKVFRGFYGDFFS
jgi:hypothetical protein